jgi:hypothetical protein
MNDPNETTRLLQVDRMIDEFAAGRSGPRPADATPTADEALVAELSGLTVIDWPPDEVGDLIARGVALRAGRSEPAAPGGRRRSRRRPAHPRRWLTAGLAAAAALLVAAVQLAPSHRGSPRQYPAINAQTLAYRTAVAVFSARADILYTRTGYAAGTAGGIGALEEWDYGISSREKLFNENGSINEDVSAVVSHGMRDRRLVYYTGKTWTEDSIAADRYGPPAGVADAVRHLLGVGRTGTTRSDGMTTVITLVNASGTRMYKITDTWATTPDAGQIYPLPMFTDSQSLPAAYIGRVLTETVWINAATHLPVRVVLNAAGGRVLASQTFAWLAPDRANLAELAPAPIPPGFRQTQPPAH